MAIEYNANTFNLAKTDIKKALSYLNIALSDSKTVLNYIPNDLINKNKLYTSKTKISDVLLRTDSLIKVFISSETKFINANSVNKYVMGSTNYTPVTSLLDGTVLNTGLSMGSDSSKGPNIFEQIGSIESKGTSSFIDGFGDLTEDIISWGKSTIDGINKTGAAISKSTRSIFKDISDRAAVMFSSGLKLLESTAATVVTSATSLLKGVLNLGESLLDFTTIATAAILSVGTVPADFVGSLFGKEFGLTDRIWTNTMANVSTKHVNGWFDSYYNDNKFGQWANENAFSGFKNGEIATNILEGIGYVAGTILLTTITMGAYGAIAGGTAVTTAATGTGLAASIGYNTVVGASIAAISGFGEGAETAWSSGADLFSGLQSATLNGLLEGTLWYVGGSINAGNFSFAKNILGKFGNALAKVGLETITGAFEFPARVLIDMIYLDNPDIIGDETFLEKWEYSWNKSGGAIGYATNVGIAGFSSIIGEGLELGFSKKSKIDLDTNTKPKANYSTEQKIKDISNLIGESDDRMYDKISKFTGYLGESAEAGNVNSKNLLDTLSNTISYFEQNKKPLNIEFNEKGVTYFSKNSNTLNISLSGNTRYIDDSVIKNVSMDLDSVLSSISPKISTISNFNKTDPLHYKNIPNGIVDSLFKKGIEYEKYLDFENNIDFFGAFTKEEYDKALREQITMAINTIADKSNGKSLDINGIAKLIDVAYTNQIKADPNVYFTPEYQSLKKFLDNFDAEKNYKVSDIMMKHSLDNMTALDSIRTQSIDAAVNYSKLIDENAILPKNEFLNLVNNSLYKKGNTTSKEINYIFHNLMENNMKIDDVSFEQLLLKFTDVVAEKNNVKITSAFKNEHGTAKASYSTSSEKVIFSRKYTNQNDIIGSIISTFHELQHAVQFQLGIDDPFYRAQILKDEALVKKYFAELDNGTKTGYYKDTYTYQSCETDARYVSYKDTLEYLEKYAPNTYKIHVDNINKEMAREISIMNVEPTINIDGILKSRSELFDELIVRDPSLVNSDLLLYLEYNPNGTRKSLDILKSDFEHYKNSNYANHSVRARYLEKLINYISSPIQKMDTSLVKKQFFTDENGKIVRVIIEGIEYNVK